MLLARAVAMALATESDINRRIQSRLRIWLKTAATCFQCVYCLKMKFSSNVTPRFKTETTSVIL